MKTRKLVSLLKKKGFNFIRQGGSHVVYSDGAINLIVPFGREIKDWLARDLLRKANKKDELCQK